jgi:hypothetical protein
MNKRSLIPIKVFYLAFGKIGTFSSYRLPEMDHGGILIFYGILPGYYFNFLDKDCGECIPEILSLAKKYKRSAFSIIDHVLKLTTNYKLQIHPHLGNIKYFSFILKDYAQNDKTMILENFDLDSYWNMLSILDIKEWLRNQRESFKQN